MTGWLPESLLHDGGSWAASQHRSRVATPRTASEWPSLEWTAPARQCSPINSLRSCATAGATSRESRSTPSTTLGPCATGEGAFLQRASGSTATTCARCTSGFCNRSVRAATVATGRPHDLATDLPVEPPEQDAPAGAVLVLDGLFLHRDELLGTWDLSIFLQVPFGVSVARMAARDGGSADPGHSSLTRYVRGQGLYFAACSPWTCADVVVDNANLDAPADLA